jgi:hypothetical protein
MSDLTIITNNVPRFTVDAYELTLEERKEFNYLNWEAIEAGEASATFFRYKGEVYDLGEFMSPSWGRLRGWHGYRSDSFFSGIVVRFVDDESIVVGRYYS